MSREPKKSKEIIIREAADGLMEMFRSGQMPEAIALTIIKRQQGDDQPSFHWSIGNQILMFFQGTSDARGFRQWQEVNRYVKKGVRAIHILGPMTKKIKEKSENGQETEKIIITGFKAIPVFRFEDTDGKPLEKPDYTPSELPPFWGIAEHLGVTVEYTAISGNYYGAYSPSKNKITLCSQDAFVYFHELAHAVHSSIKELKAGQDAEEEIVAEMSACVLCHLQGIKGYESQAFNYIQSYIAKMKEQDVLKAIMRVLSEIEAVVLKVITIAEGIKRKDAVMVG